MGCGTSLPATTGQPQARTQRQPTPRSKRGPPRLAAASAPPLLLAKQLPVAAAAAAAAEAGPVLSPTEILDLCEAALSEDPRLRAVPEATAVALCALALCESSGEPKARHRGADIYGLWAMPLSTARWLASKEGWSAQGTPGPASLERPGTSAYFAAALLAAMYRHGGRRRGELFAVLAFHSGPGAAAAACRRRRRAAAAKGGGGASAQEWCEGDSGDWGNQDVNGYSRDAGSASGSDDGDDDDDDDGDDDDCGGDDCGGGGGRGRAPDQLPADRWGACDGGADGRGSLPGFWRRYVRAKGLVARVSRALDLRRRAAPGGGGGDDGGWGGGGFGGAAFGDSACMMHLVHQGETLKKIAAISGTTTADLLAANPDLPGESALQPNDLITIPVPAIVPRLHALRPGDSLRSLSRQYGVTLGRLLACNPELCDPRGMQPGWVVLVPGLKGDSEAAATAAAEAAARPAPPAPFPPTALGPLGGGGGRGGGGAGEAGALGQLTFLPGP